MEGVLRSIVISLPHLKDEVHSKILKLENVLLQFFGEKQA
jgi:hypothetical protein